MEVIMKGDPKEIAALVLAVQEWQRQDVGKIGSSMDGHKISRTVLETIEKLNKMSASEYLTQRKAAMDSVKDR